jgi:outer membrane protein OmpA-like peptidoglycan-associated protein
MKTSEAPVQYDTTSVVVTYAVKYVATIYFKADSASLEAKDFETLEKVQRLLLDNAEYQAIVEGYTNNIPSADYCLKLGAERADGVISWLRSRGIGDERIIRKVFGKTRTGSKLDGAQHRKRHQRVEIKIVKREG